MVKVCQTGHMSNRCYMDWIDQKCQMSQEGQNGQQSHMSDGSGD